MCPCLSKNCDSAKPREFLKTIKLHGGLNQIAFLVQYILVLALFALYTSEDAFVLGNTVMN